MSETLDNFRKGILDSNPVLVLLLGLCPTLAVSTSVDNGLGMTAAVLFVLLCANIIVSLIRDFIPDRVRIPVFIVVIATLVTIVDLTMQAFLPALSDSLGIFIPLIVVNCIILGRAEAFASKNDLKNSVADALGMVVGFGLAILIISFFRQLLGTGKLAIFGQEIVAMPGLSDNPMAVFILPMGAFMVLGVLIATLRYTGVIEYE
ncbi:MAG: electron transport complex subunit RsxE [Thermoplasmatota archaeon]